MDGLWLPGVEGRKGQAQHSDQVCLLKRLPPGAPILAKGVHLSEASLHTEKSWGPSSSQLTSNSINDGILMERAGLDVKKKKIVFLFTHLLLKFTVSFPCEDQWQTTVFAVPVSVCHQEKSQIFSYHIAVAAAILKDDLCSSPLQNYGTN